MTWAVTTEPAEDYGSISSQYPLATLAGIHTLNQILLADSVWRHLTGPQRELLLSAAAGYPIKARVDVAARMVGHGLITDDSRVTDAGRLVVALRPL